MADKRVIEQTASTELFDDDWFLKDSVLEGTTKISASVLAELFTGDVNDRVDKLLRNIIGPTYEWSASKTYKAGAIVYYEDSLYFCIVDTATVGTFVPSEWRYTDLYENLTGKINSVIKMLAPYMQFSDISSIMPYSKGDIVRYQPTGTYKEKFYVAKEDLPEGIESYDPNDWDEYDTIGELIAGIMAEAGKVDDVKVDGTSVVTNKVAEIEIPVKDVQVKTDSTYDSVVDASGNAKIDLSSVTAYGEVPNLPQAIATFKDGADAPMKSLKVAIEPQQEGSGDPSPENIRPISGWSEADVSVSGVNVWDEEWELGSIGGTGQPVSSNTNVRNKFDNPIRVVPSTTYYMVKPAVKNEVFFYKKDGTFITYTVLNENTHEFSTPSECSYIRFLLYSGYGTTYNNDISINYPSTDTEYHAYNGHTYTIDLDGTRYGGELDVTSGVLTVDNKHILIDGDTKKVSSWGTANPNGFTAFISDTDITRTNKIISDRFKYSGSAITSMPSFSTGGGSGSNGVISFVLDNTITTINEANAWFASNNTSVIAELATPLTIQLTPTQVKSLLGQNNIWADTGDITDAEYVRDATATINDILARLEALEG